jgi:hypothetical protein
MSSRSKVCARGTETGRTALNLEPLERRLLLSGVVAVKQSGGKLTLKGDSSSNEVLLERTGEFEYLITPLDSTQVDVGFGPTTVPQAVSNVTKDLKFKMGDGDDEVAVSGGAPRSIVFDGGTGANALLVGDATVGKHIKIKDKGTDAEFFLENADVYGGIKVSNRGDGVTSLFDVSVEGAVKIQNKGLYAEVSLESADVYDRVKVSNKGYGVTSLHDVAISGKVDVRNKGFGDLAVSEADIFGRLKVTNDRYGSSTVIQGFGIDGIKVTNKGGPDDLVLEDGVVYGDLSIKNGSGGSSTVLDITEVRGDVKVKNGEGVNSFVAGDLYVWDDLTVSNGTGDTSFDLDWVVVDGGVSVANRTGFDEIIVTEVDIGGSLLLELGSGGSLVTIEAEDEPNYVGGDLLIAAGWGENDIWVGNTYVHAFADIITGGSNDHVTVLGIDVLALYVDTGDGADIVEVDDSALDDTLDIYLGWGNDDLYVGEHDGIDVGYLAVFDGGPGYDAYLIYDGFDYLLFDFEATIV